MRSKPAENLRLTSKVCHFEPACGKDTARKIVAPLPTDCATLQEVSVDALLPDVLHFPSGTDLHDHPLVQSACLILQVNSHSVYTLDDMYVC